MTNENGAFKCEARLIEDKVNGVIEDMNDLASVMEEIKQDHQHLRRISASNEVICSTLQEIRQSLINAVLGKEIVPVGVATRMIEEQRKAYVTIIKTLCWVFGVITSVLVGLKLLAPQWFN